MDVTSVKSLISFSEWAAAPSPSWQPLTPPNAQLIQKYGACVDLRLCRLLFCCKHTRTTLSLKTFTPLKF